jgi:hypothetical protein
LAFFGDFLAILAIFGDFWRFLAIFGDFWRFLAIFGDFLGDVAIRYFVALDSPVAGWIRYQNSSRTEATTDSVPKNSVLPTNKQFHWQQTKTKNKSFFSWAAS